MLDPVDVDTQRDHAAVLTDVHPVDHQRHQIQPGQGRSAAVTNRRDTADFDVLTAACSTREPTGSSLTG